MKLSAKKNKLNIEAQETLTQGTVGQKMTIELDENWNGLIVTAVLSAGQTSIDVLLDNNSIIIPWELLREKGKKVFVNLYGIAENGKVVLTTNIVSLGVVLPSNSPSGSDPDDYTPSRLDQLQAIALRAQRMASVAMGYEPKTPTVVDDEPISGSENLITSGGVQKAICQKNYLDNWYFGNPVNQRGQTSYTGSGYSIDRWRMWDNSGVLSIVSGGISYVSDNDKLFSYLPNSPFKNGDTITISALINRNLITATGQKASDIVDINSSGGEIHYYETDESGNYSIGYAIKGFDSSTIISAVKLELGNTQTLAHQENGVWVLNEIPDYGEELLKCQRYYQLYRTESMRPTFSADCRPVMRTEPVQDTLTIDNVTYYTNSAEL